MTEPPHDDAPAVRPSPAGSRAWWRLAAVALPLPLLAMALPWLRVPLAVIAILVVLLGCGQSSLIYFPPRHGPEARPDGPAQVVALAYRSGGAPQQAYYIPPRQATPAGRTWLVFG